MKITLVVFAAALAFCGGAAWADDAPGPQKGEQERFQMMKQEMLKDLDARIGALQKVRECVGAAADPAAVQKCHEEEKAAMKAFEAAKRQERIRRIEEKQKELDKEKQELLQKNSQP